MPLACRSPSSFLSKATACSLANAVASFQASKMSFCWSAFSVSNHFLEIWYLQAE